MPDEIEQLELKDLHRALFVMWAWSFNPDLLEEDSLEWFYNYIIKKYAKNSALRTYPQSEPSAGNLPAVADTGQGKI